MKNKRIVIVFLLTTLLLVACSSYPNLNIEDKIDEVKVSTFKDFGSVNEDYHLFFKNEEDIKTFVDAINKSKLMNGDVDMPEADYDFLLDVNDEESEGFHLWISAEYSTGTIVRIDDTATAYTLTKSLTNKLREILFH